MDMNNYIVFLSHLNYVWIFIWTMYFKVFDYRKKNTYNFTIRVYIIFSVSCQKCVFDNLVTKSFATRLNVILDTHKIYFNLYLIYISSINIYIYIYIYICCSRYELSNDLPSRVVKIRSWLVKLHDFTSQHILIMQNHFKNLKTDKNGLKLF
jgi:hypothetical protein